MSLGVPIVPVPIPVVPVAPVLRPLFAPVIRPSLASPVVVGIDAADGNAEGTHGKGEAEKTLFHVGPPRVKVARGFGADLATTHRRRILGIPSQWTLRAGHRQWPPIHHTASSEPINK